MAEAQVPRHLNGGADKLNPHLTFLFLLTVTDPSAAHGGGCALTALFTVFQGLHLSEDLEIVVRRVIVIFATAFPIHTAIDEAPHALRLLCPVGDLRNAAK